MVDLSHHQRHTIFELPSCWGCVPCLTTPDIKLDNILTQSGKSVPSHDFWHSLTYNSGNGQGSYWCPPSQGGSVAQLYLTLRNPIDCSPPGSSVHGILQASSGIGVHSLLQGIFPTQGLEPGVPHCRQMLYHLSHQGSPSPGQNKSQKTQQRDCPRKRKFTVVTGVTLCSKGWVPVMPTLSPRNHAHQPPSFSISECSLKGGGKISSYRLVVKNAVQSLGCVWLFVTPWTAAYQASLSFTI